jgi:DNA-binding NarL/FixJ family response regulator
MIDSGDRAGAEPVEEVIAMAEPDPRVRVLIVDDQRPFRAAATAVVESIDGFEVVDAVENAEQAIDGIERTGPELVLMDLNLPGMDGVTASRLLRERHPEIMVVLLSSYDEAEFTDLISDCGASAYVPKASFGPDRLEALWRERSRPVR